MDADDVTPRRHRPHFQPSTSPGALPFHTSLMLLHRRRAYFWHCEIGRDKWHGGAWLDLMRFSSVSAMAYPELHEYAPKSADSLHASRGQPSLILLGVPIRRDSHCALDIWRCHRARQALTCRRAAKCRLPDVDPANASASAVAASMTSPDPAPHCFRRDLDGGVGGAFRHQ